MQPNNPSRKRDDMFRIITAWQNSGMTQKAFCREQGLKPSLFYYWLRKYRKTDPADTHPESFIPIELSPVKERHNVYACVLEYPDGTVLRLGTFPGITDLLRLLRMG